MPAPLSVSKNRGKTIRRARRQSRSAGAGGGNSNSSSNNMSDTSRRPSLGESSGPAAQGSSATSPACDECRSKKIRCNREEPECSNCQRTNSTCTYSNRGRRTNHTKQLADDLAGFGARLDTLGGATSSLAERMDQLTALVSSARSLPVSDMSPESGTFDIGYMGYPRGSMSSSGSRHNSFSDQEKLLSATLPQIVIEKNGDIFYYGACSTISLIAHARASVQQLLARNQRPAEANYPSPDSSDAIVSPSESLSQGQMSSRPPFPTLDHLTYSTVQRKFESYNVPRANRDDPASDGCPLELPPRELVELALAFYFSRTDLTVPLLQEEAAAEAVQGLYAHKETTEPDLAWILCFNSIILMFLSWEAKLNTNHPTLLNHMDDNMLALLMMNTKRAIQDIEIFQHSRMLNVKALLLLAVVARMYFHFSVFERVFYKTCQLAKSMGLHEFETGKEVPPQQSIERRNLVWALYAIDKQRVFVKGSPCHVYMFECNLETPGTEIESPFGEHLVAYLQMTCLMEEIYKGLYSPQAKRQRGDLRQGTVERFSRELRAWWSRNHLALAEWTGAKAILSLQLRFVFHSTFILVHRCGISGPSESARLDNAHIALGLVRDLCNGTHLSGDGLPALEWSVNSHIVRHWRQERQGLTLEYRLFCGFSTIAYFELFEDVLRRPDPKRLDDLNLLTTFSDAFRLISHSNYPQSYCTRIHKSLAWCSEIIAILLSPSRVPDQQRSGRSTASTEMHRFSPPSSQFSLTDQQKEASPPATGLTEMAFPSNSYQSGPSVMRRNDLVNPSLLSMQPRQETGTSFIATPAMSDLPRDQDFSLSMLKENPDLGEAPKDTTMTDLSSEPAQSEPFGQNQFLIREDMLGMAEMSSASLNIYLNEMQWGGL